MKKDHIETNWKKKKKWITTKRRKKIMKNKNKKIKKKKMKQNDKIHKHLQGLCRKIIQKI
jgi:hypothetical protein